MAGRTEERDRMKQLLVEAISTLCRSGLQYSNAMRVEGLLAITLDEQDIIVVNVNKTYKSQCNESKCVSPTVEETQDTEDQCDMLEENSHLSESEFGQETLYKSGHKRTLSATYSKSPAKKKKSWHGTEEAVHSLASSCSPANDNSRDSNFSGSLHPLHSDNEQNRLCTQITPSSSHSNSSKPAEEPQIKIEINSDSDCDGKEGVMEDLNLIFSGQNELVQVSQSHEPMPVSMYSENGQPLPVPSNMLLIPTSTSGAPYQQPTTSMLAVDQQSVQHNLQYSSTDDEPKLVHYGSKFTSVRLMYRGYCHQRNKRNANHVKGDLIYWRCRQFNSGCKGKVHTVHQAGSLENFTIIHYTEHDHPPLECIP